LATNKDKCFHAQNFKTEDITAGEYTFYKYRVIEKDGRDETAIT